MTNLFDVSKSSFVCAVPVEKDWGWVVMAMDDLGAQEIEHSAILRFRGGAFEAVVLKMFRSKSVLWLPGRQEALCVGDNGECTAIDAAGQDRDEYVTTSARSPRNTGHIRSAVRLGDEVIAVGMQRQVYRRDASGQWRDMMQGLPAPSAETGGFECCVAVSDTEIYAAGWRGEIWLWDGRAWRPIDSPTNRIITAMSLGPDGSVLACGRNGMLLQGKHDTWNTVHDGECPDDLWSIEHAFGQAFTAGLRRLYTIEDPLALADTNPAHAGSFGFLVSREDVLWSLGEKDFISYDGRSWTKIV